MAESTLTLTRLNLANRVSHFLSFGADYTGLAAADATICTNAVDDGYRRTLGPPPVLGQRKGHRWSFLKPTTTLTLWANISSATGETITYTSYDAGPPQLTTLTVTGATPFITGSVMVGHTITIDGSDYVVSSVTSTTVIVVITSGDELSAVSEAEYSMSPNGVFFAADNFGGIESDIVLQASASSQ